MKGNWQSQVLVRTWRCWNSQIAGGKGNEIATLANSRGVSYKVKQTLAMWPNSLIPSYSSKWSKNLCSQENLNVNVLAAVVIPDPNRKQPKCPAAGTRVNQRCQIPKRSTPQQRKRNGLPQSHQGRISAAVCEVKKPHSKAATGCDVRHVCAGAERCGSQGLEGRGGMTLEMGRMGGSGAALCLDGGGGGYVGVGICPNSEPRLKRVMWAHVNYSLIQKWRN